MAKRTRKTASAARKRAASKADTRRAPPNNGMQTFAMHAFDAATKPMVNELMDERSTRPAFALTDLSDVGQLDPETVATRYLKEALQSPAIPSLTAPKADDVESEFKSLGTETIPLTGTTTVKFRQSLNKIPVYGSLVTVELDNKNNLVSIGSSLGKPSSVDSIAKIAAADAVKAVAKYPGYRKQLDGVTPLLNYYFDRTNSKWRLVYILEDVAVSAAGQKGKEIKNTPLYMDYVVDAHSGKLVSESPRTPSMASSTESALDGLGKSRQFQVEGEGVNKVLHDTTLNVQTFDFDFKDPEIRDGDLPGKTITSPPAWTPAAVSAHCNACEVAKFLRQVLRRNNVDANGGVMTSSINCVVARQSPDGKQWFNAFWNHRQMVYGQRANGESMMSLSVDLDVVGHEMFHGVTEKTARLEYEFETGALNESISDIFGIIIANSPNPDTRTWNWKIGDGLSPNGKAFRDMSNPASLNQPDHMKDFKVLPKRKDSGGVHINSGIHNKAAFNILVAADTAGKLVLTPEDVAAIFYLTLTQQLSRTSLFGDSRRGALLSARTLFRSLPAQQQTEKIDAIAKGFDAVGIV